MCQREKKTQIGVVYCLKSIVYMSDDNANTYNNITAYLKR